MSYYQFNQSFKGVVTHLIIINVLVYLGTAGWADRYQLSAFVPGTLYFEPYQIATHMFMHADPGHLFFNMMTLYFFGPMVEMVWGHKRFLIYYLICGVGAYACQAGVYYLSASGAIPGALDHVSMLGASGAIFGILAAFAYLFPNQMMSLIFLPIPIKAKYFVPLMAALELVWGVKGGGPPIAHFAHLGGGLTGFILIMIWYKGRFRNMY
jgi:membrane associated rhomboid family serine protease